ncbi:Abi family protein [Mediterraneibacter glycyrrhizinilyticus]|nr:Abi family protein [Mediterraneibacter glycyrrhizinilyticus]
METYKYRSIFSICPTYNDIVFCNASVTLPCWADIRNCSESLFQKVYARTFFDEIVTFYQFDAGHRVLFLKYLLRIERHIGNLISYYFVEAHGISQTEYMDPYNYNKTGEDCPLSVDAIKPKEERTSLLVNKIRAFWNRNGSC